MVRAGFLRPARPLHVPGTAYLVYV